MDHRPLGSSGIDVSVLSLGSWRTYERLSREQGVAVMRAAREVGIDFLDDARHDDETGTAPIPTGYSEIVFGELFRSAGWRRDEVVVANKLWWEFWPEQTAQAEVDASLARMGFDHFDLVYAARPPEGTGVTEIVAAVAGVVAAGKARAWGVLSWPPAQLTEAFEFAQEHGLPEPCAAQLAYNVLDRSLVVGEAARIDVVASAVLGGGVLSGKYAQAGAAGRLVSQLDDPAVREEMMVAELLREIAERRATTAAALALAFGLAGPRVSTVLFGATRPEQVLENARALDVDPATVAEVRAVGLTGRPDL